MTISSTTKRSEFSGNGAAGPHTVGFTVLGTSHLQVYWTKGSSSPGTPSGVSASGYLTIDTHYTVQNAGTTTNATITFVASGWTVDSTVTYPPSGDTMVITRNVPLTQATNYQNNATIDAETIEQSFDKITQISHQLDDGKDYGIKFAPFLSGSTGFNTTVGAASTISLLKADRLNKYVAFDANGDLTVTGSAAGIVLTVSSVEGHILRYDATQLSYINSDILALDDVKLYFGTGKDVSIEYDENGNDTLSINGDTLLEDDKKLYFGSAKDCYIEYDEDGLDTMVLGLPTGGGQILDDKPLYFGTGKDVAVQYDEASSDTLLFTGTGYTFTSTTNLQPIFTLKNTNSGVTGPTFKFINDKGAAGADNDVCGIISFYGDDDNQDNIEFAKIEGIVADASNGDECGTLKLSVAENDGTNTAGLTLTGSTTDGEVDVTIGAGAASLTTIQGNLKVGGTLTYVNSTNTTLVDPIIHLQTGTDGAALGSDTNKDVGLALRYYTGGAQKIAFLGWDDSAAKLTFVPDASISSEVVSGSAGTIVANLEGNVTGNVTGTINTVTVADESSDTSCYPLFVTGASGSLAPKSGSNLTFNSSTGVLTATGFVGPLTGNVTGNSDTVTTNANLTGDVTSSGNATSIASDVIVNADIKSDAAIAISKTALVAGTGITLSTNTLNVDVAQTQITSVGTLTSLQTSGSVGIGTSPSTELHIKGTGAQEILIESDDQNAILTLDWDGTDEGIILFKEGGTEKGRIFVDGTNEDMHFRTAGTDRLLIEDSGKVNIGPDATANHDLLNINYDKAGSVGIAIRNYGDAGNSTDETIDFTGYMNANPSSGNTGYSRIRFGKEADHSSGANISQFISFGTTYADSFSEKMRISAAGKVAIGTTSPDQKLTVAATGNGATIGVDCYSVAAGHAAELYLTKSNNDTLGTQTLVTEDDVLGTIWFQGSNGTASISGAGILAIAQATTGSGGDMPSKLVFRTSADGSGTPSDRMTISSAGNVGIGTDSPAQALDVAGPTGAIIQLTREDTSIGALDGLGGIRWAGNDPSQQVCANIAVSSEETWSSGVCGARMDFATTNPGEGTAGNRWGITGGGNFLPASSVSYVIGNSTFKVHTITVYNAPVTGSDEAYKQNIVDCPLGEDFINTLRPVRFDWKTKVHDNDECDKYGLIAQDILETDMKDSVDGEDGEYSLPYEQFMAPMIKAIQELSAKVTALENA